MSETQENGHSTFQRSDVYGANIVSALDNIEPHREREGHALSQTARVVRGGSWADACFSSRKSSRSNGCSCRYKRCVSADSCRRPHRFPPCSPSNISDSALLPHVFDVPSIHSVNLREVVEGYFTMGTDDAQAAPEARPAHRVWLDTFFMSAAEVTVAEFRKFVALTNYTPSSACRTVAGVNGPLSNLALSRKKIILWSASQEDAVAFALTIWSVTWHRLCRQRRSGKRQRTLKAVKSARRNGCRI